ncbi:SAM domain-containing protein SAMSN-1b isoform X1 [Nerophis ophidion]|uniref:SAM domain-containing protein SAMSN-1b isoform X1 n=1 Tax=Nerophis ophidion TaxID=159077 RepID=UPI002ADF40D3|nr:SAM domain-containing protein SAMSN-1b isoform X1 [Nerophis ophidion]
MNFFCFTLDGSTESIYEATQRPSLKEVLPKCQCSPLLRRRPQWTGSDPNISCVQRPNNVRLKRNNRSSCIPTSALDIDSSGTDSSCGTASGVRRGGHDQETEQKTASSQRNTWTSEVHVNELNCGRTKTNLPTQGGQSADGKEEQMPSTAGRLNLFHTFLQAKKGHQNVSGKGKNGIDRSHVTDVLSASKPVLTCVGLGKRAEKTSCESDQRMQQQEVKSLQEDVKKDGVWSPTNCSQPWPPLYHTCHQPGHDLWVCDGNLLLPRATEWDRFESLIQELDRKESHHLSPDVNDRTTEDKCSRFGASSTSVEMSPSVKLAHKTGSLLEQNGQASKPRQREDLPDADITPTESTAGRKNGDNKATDAEKKDFSVRRKVVKGHKLSSTSLESVYSRQSSSSGVTSWSDCSSNRDSLRLEDDVLSTRQFCGRARVHTEFVPSPYDTESLKLQVGDVIDIIHKPAMGIWTGMLNNNIGNFKFIYVDLTETGPSENRISRPQCRSTINEVLKHFSLEEYSTSLQQNGYQTVDDLMRLREHHLPKLKVSDPEHGRSLLAAVESLKQLCFSQSSLLCDATGDVAIPDCDDCHMEKESSKEAETPSEHMKGDMKTCPRDSGCHMSSDGEVTEHNFHDDLGADEMTAS